MGHWGTGAGATVTATATAMAMAMGQQQQWDNGVPIAIDRVDVDVWGVGRGACQHDRLLFRVFYSKR
jgi:hypothetical protein